MKKGITAGLVVCLIVGFVLFGCGKKEETHTVSTPDGKMKVTTDKSGDGGRVEIETKEGKTVITGGKGGTVTEAQLGVPLYPGATLKSSSKMEGGAAGKEGAVEIYTLISSDNWEKVAAFYKSNLKNVKGSVTHGSGEQGMAMFSIGDDSNVNVNVIGDKKGETVISVAKKLR